MARWVVAVTSRQVQGTMNCPFDVERVVVGSEPSAHIQLDHREVAGRALSLVYSAGRYSVRAGPDTANLVLHDGRSGRNYLQPDEERLLEGGEARLELAGFDLRVCFGDAAAPRSREVDQREDTLGGGAAHAGVSPPASKPRGPTSVPATPGEPTVSRTDELWRSTPIWRRLPIQLTIGKSAWTDLMIFSRDAVLDEPRLDRPGHVRRDGEVDERRHPRLKVWGKDGAEHFSEEGTLIGLDGDGTFLVGRSSDNDLVLNAPTVSRRHAQVCRSGDKFLIRNLKPVNAFRITPRAGRPQKVKDAKWRTLQDGDELGFGPFRLRYYSSVSESGHGISIGADPAEVRRRLEREEALSRRRVEAFAALPCYRRVWLHIAPGRKAWLDGETGRPLWLHGTVLAGALLLVVGLACLAT